MSPTNGLQTTEGAGTASFTVALNIQPTADVIIALDSSVPSEATTSPTTLTFTSSNWNVAQLVTVTGLDDRVDDGDQPYAVTLAPATSVDPNFDGQDPPDVVGTNTDDDTAGITLMPPGPLVTSEAGAQATFTVVLTSQPTADINLALTSSNVAEGTAAPELITFDSTNWEVPQTVTVAGVNDFVDDGDVAYQVTVTQPVITDPTYAAVVAAEYTVTNSDDDTAGFDIVPATGLATDEGGGTAEFTVRLTSKPIAAVDLGLTPSDGSEGTVSPALLTFTDATWDQAQTVTVTGENDPAIDGDIAYTVVTSPAVSLDPRYNMLDPLDPAVVNNDNDAPGFVLSRTSGLVVTEAGNTATFRVRLTSQPNSSVTFSVRSSDVSEGTVTPAMLTFTGANWDADQTVTVTGVDDGLDDGNRAFIIINGTSASTDPNFNAIDVPNVTANCTDDDVSGFTVTATSGLTTDENGDTALFTVVLNAQPLANVTTSISSSDTTEGTVSRTSLTFTSTNWDEPQPVVVTGVDDNRADGNVRYHVVIGAASSTDANYSGINPADVFLTNLDLDYFSTTTRVSVSSTGAEANHGAAGASLSTDGRFVVFASYSDTLGAGELDGIGQVFVYDGFTNTVELVSRSNSGAVANSGCFQPAISGDGRYVVFYTLADNLVTGDTNDAFDAFLRDRQGNTTTRVSVSTGSAQGDRSSGPADISEDGSTVVFASNASNLVAGDTNESEDIFIRTLATNTTTRVSTTQAGGQANGPSFHPRISRSSNLFGVTLAVVYVSNATNLDPLAADTNTTQDIFLWRQTDPVLGESSTTVARVSVSSSEAQASNYSQHPDVAGGGEYVVFTSIATNLVSGDTNGDLDVFLRIRSAGTTTRVSLTDGDAQATGNSEEPRVSDDGDIIVFASRATTLVPGDNNGVTDVFVRDRSAGTTRRFSSLSGGDPDLASGAPCISGDGRYVGMWSQALNLTSRLDNNDRADVFVRPVP